MLEFAYPWLFILLPLPLLIWRLFPPYRQRVSAVRVPFFASIVKVSGQRAGSGSVVMQRSILQIVGMACVWMLLVLAIAKPEWVGEPVVKSESARDVMLALDLSGSMDQADFPDQTGKNVRRFDAVTTVVLEFIAARKDDRIGMIIFGDRAYVQLPFTRDLQTAAELVELMEVGMAGQQTALGDAIGLSIKSFETSEVDERVLILLSDGSDTVSKMTPVNASEIARQNDVEIYTIGVGDPSGKGDKKADFDILEKIATTTGGQFFVAENQLDLQQVYERIDALTAAETKTRSWRPRESLVHLPAAVVLIICIPGYIVMLIGRRRKQSVQVGSKR